MCEAVAPEVVVRVLDELNEGDLKCARKENHADISTPIDMILVL